MLVPSGWGPSALLSLAVWLRPESSRPRLERQSRALNFIFIPPMYPNMLRQDHWTDDEYDSDLSFSPEEDETVDIESDGVDSRTEASNV